MYDLNLNLSESVKNERKAMTLASIERFNESLIDENVIKEQNKLKNSKECDMVLEKTAQRKNIIDRYNSFSETVRTSLVTESIYKLFIESVPSHVKCDTSDRAIMRSIVNNYVIEEGYDNILYKMKSKSVSLAEMSIVINNSIKNIMEAVDKTNPDTFAVTPQMKDDFFNQLDYNDTESISDAIKDRVTNSIQDFVACNKKDHDDINSALQAAQEKIDQTPEEDTDLRESFSYMAKRKINDIRNTPKSVLHSMITSTCESVLKHPDSHVEFMTEGHLDMDKIVNRNIILYSFMEMLNTSRLEKIDESFIDNIINGLKE